MLKGVGAAIIKPKQMGMFMGMNELNLCTQGMNSLVSGWIAVETTVCAIRSCFICSWLHIVLLCPVVTRDSYSALLCTCKRSRIPWIVLFE